MFTQFQTAILNHHASTPSFDGPVTQTLKRTDFESAEREIANWDGYAETPLIDFPGLAGKLGIRDLRYKHEGPRFGLGSFKALGGAYAVLRTVQRELSRSFGKLTDPADLRRGLYAEHTNAITLISATDGNHGRSVAWGAAQFHTSCRIYIHAELSLIHI